jgi:DtxR family Mn-dependent transcriptional regulator
VIAASEEFSYAEFVQANNSSPQTSESVARYLKAIFELGGTEDLVATTVLAERLGVRTPSATGMAQRLACEPQPLVIYRKREGVRLTPAGARKAGVLIRQNQLLKSFLRGVLGCSPWEAQKEANRLEHVLSRRLEQRIAAVLEDRMAKSEAA